MSGDSSTILLIDPSDDSRALHADALGRAGFNVVAVTDCDIALNALMTQTPQLIVASFDPRTRDECLAFCERLKEDPQTRAIPILLTSDAINRDDVRRATDTKALVLSLDSRHDDVKLTSAVRGVLSVSQGIRLRDSLPPQESRGSLRRGFDLNGTVSDEERALARSDARDERRYWSKRGDVACASHVPYADSDEWRAAGWREIPDSENGRHGLTYQCPQCAPDGRPHRHVQRETTAS